MVKFELDSLSRAYLRIEEKTRSQIVTAGRGCDLTEGLVHMQSYGLGLAIYPDPVERDARLDHLHLSQDIQRRHGHLRNDMREKIPRPGKVSRCNTYCTRARGSVNWRGRHHEWAEIWANINRSFSCVGVLRCGHFGVEELREGQTTRHVAALAAKPACSGVLGWYSIEVNIHT
ncbi:hypothetical protein L208DRAFT_504463 [Tricholoma matsutake]|nr:hypothetical protein L208DRAFT_504463 [Tricholoma matsutake 945]